MEAKEGWKFYKYNHLILDPLFQFLDSQKLIVIASAEDNQPWIANVYYGVNKGLKLYFISSRAVKHSQLILKNPSIAFSVTWHDLNNSKNRKGVQGLGQCGEVKTIEEIKTGVSLHNQRFPEFADRISAEWLMDKANDTSVWVIEPSYIKFLNDELYGDRLFKEFKF